MAVAKKRFTLMKPVDTEESAAALAGPNAASALADLFVGGRTKASRKSDEFFEPDPGEAVFDSEDGVLHVNDGTSVHAGHPCTPCPDCEGDLVLERRERSGRASPWTYECENRPAGCRASCLAKVDGSLMGVPANAETRRARRLTREVFDRLWQDAPSVLTAAPGEDRKAAVNAARAQAYRWFAYAMELTGKPAGIGTMDIETLRRAYRICNSANPADVESFSKEAPGETKEGSPEP